MKRPKERSRNDCQCLEYSYCGCNIDSFNEAIDEFNAFLPTEKELKDIVCKACDKYVYDDAILPLVTMIATALHKRLKGE